jgi:hypothetical protein
MSEADAKIAHLEQRLAEVERSKADLSIADLEALIAAKLAERDDAKQGAQEPWWSIMDLVHEYGIHLRTAYRWAERHGYKLGGRWRVPRASIVQQYGRPN